MGWLQGEKLQPGNCRSELERIARLESSDLEALATARLREIQEVCKAKTMELNAWTEDLTRDLRAVSEAVQSSSLKSKVVHLS